MIKHITRLSEGAFIYIFAAILAMALPTRGTAQTWNMVNGDTIFIDACDYDGGTIYDDGGPDGNYSNNFNGWVVIQATNGVGITLSGDYNIESPTWDHLYVYDGSTNGATLVEQVGNSGSINVTATSGRMTIYFHSDGSINYGGFALNWSASGYSGICSSNISSFEASNVTATSAMLTWMANANETLMLDYGHGAQAVTGNSITLTGLNPNTMYVAKLYAASDVGSRCCVEYLSFRTGCGLMTAPLVETFDDLTTGEMPPCWSQGKNFDTEELFPTVTNATSKSGSHSLLLSSGGNTTANHFGMVMGPNMCVDMSTLKMRVSLRSNYSNAKVEVGICDSISNLYNYFGFTPIDTLTISSANTWYDYEVDFSSYSGDGSRVAFRMRQGMEPSANCIVYIDDIIVENCGVDNLATSHIGIDKMTLSWELIGTPSVDLIVTARHGSPSSIQNMATNTIDGNLTNTNYVQEHLSYPNGPNGMQVVMHGVTSPVSFHTMDENGVYELTLQPSCNGIYGESKSVTASLLTNRLGNLAQCEDFEYGFPSEWIMTEQFNGNPTISGTGGSQTVRLYSYYDNETSIAIPPSTDFNLDTVTVRFRMKTDVAGCGVTLKITEDPNDDFGMHPADDTIVSANSDWKYYTVRLALGATNFLRIRTYTPTSNNCYIYLDDIAISHCPLSGLQVTQVTNNSVTLEWDSSTLEQADSVVIEYGTMDFVLANGSRIAILGGEIVDGRVSHTVSGLDSATTYEFVVYRSCGDNLCNPERVTATTLQRYYTVPFCENFDNVTGDDYVYLPDWARPAMYDNRPCLWQYGESAPSPDRVLDMHSRGLLSNGYAHSTAVLPHLNYEGELSDLVVNFYGQFNSDCCMSYLEVGVLTNPNDEETFTVVQTVNLPQRRFGHFAVPLHGYSDADGYIGLRYYHSNNGDYLTIGIDNIEVRTNGIGAAEIHGLRTDGGLLEFDTVGEVGSITLRLINDNDTMTFYDVSSPYYISDLQPGTTYRYELDYGQCYPVGGTFTTRNEMMNADWCYNFETTYNGSRFDGLYYPVVYNIYNTEAYQGTHAIYLQSYNNYRTAMVLPYLEMEDYTDLHFSFMYRSDYHNRTIVGLMLDERDTTGFFPIDTIIEDDNIWREYDYDLTGLEGYGHHLVLISYTSQSSYNTGGVFDNLRIDHGNRLTQWSHTTTATSADINWAATAATNIVQVILSLNGETVFDSIVTATEGTCHIGGLSAATTYQLQLIPISDGSSQSCTLEEKSIRTLSHDVANGFCEQFDGDWNTVPTGWNWVEHYGQQPWRADFMWSDGCYAIALRSQSTSDAYTMLVMPEASVPLQGLALGLTAWYDNRESVLASQLVVGVMDNQYDTTTFTAIDTLWLTGYKEHYAVDLSVYSGNGRYVAFKAMSLPGYDRTTYVTNIGLADRIANKLLAYNITSTSASLRWDNIGTTGIQNMHISGGNTSIDTLVSGNIVTLTGLQPGTIYTATIPSEALNETSAITNYSNLSLSDFTQLSSYTSVNFPDGYTKAFLVHNVKRILVSSIGGSDQNCVINIDPNNGEAEPNSGDDDKFSFCRTDLGWQHSWSNLLYDNTNIGEVAHTYYSNASAAQAMTVTYSNLGWILEFNLPVCITYGQMNILNNNLYYQCDSSINNENFPICQQRNVKFATPADPVVSPQCIPMDEYYPFNTDGSMVNMPQGWVRPYGNAYPFLNSNYYHRDQMTLEFYSSYCNEHSDMTSMAVSPYFPEGFNGLWLDFYTLNESWSGKMLIGSMSDPYDTATFVPHDYIESAYGWRHISLPISNYSGNYLAFKYITESTCSSGSCYINSISVMNCPLPETWFSHQEDTSVWVHWSGTAPVWVEYQMGGDFTVGTGHKVLIQESPAIFNGLASAASYTFHIWPQCGEDTTFRCNHQTMYLTTMFPPVSVPYCFNFESYGDWGYPDEWSRWNPDGTTCSVISYAGHDDSRALHLTSSYTNSVASILPKVEPMAGCTDSLYLNFWARRLDQNPILVIGITEDISDTLSFTAYDTITVSNDWQHHTTALPAAELQSGRVVMRLLHGGDMVIDNLCLETCVAANVAVGDLTQHTATVTWEGHGVDTLVCEYGRQGFALGTGYVVNITTSPYVISGLDASSDYNFIFRTICSCPEETGSVYPAGGGTRGSVWYDGHHWITYAWIDTALYPDTYGWGLGYGGGNGLWGAGGGLSMGRKTQAEVLSTPYCEDFDTLDVGVLPAGWRRIAGSVSGFPRTNRTPVLSGARNIDLYTTTGYSNHLALPPVENPSGLVLSFQVWCNNNELTYDYYGALTVGVMDDPDRGNTFVAIDTVTVSATNKWTQCFVDLSQYSGTGQYIAFRFTPMYSPYHIYLDNVYLGSSVITDASVSTTTQGVQLSYSTLGNSDGVIVEWDSTGTTTITSSPSYITGLSTDMHYELRLKSFNDVDTQSDCHLTPIAVNPVLILPYCEDFDAMDGIYPSGWQPKQTYSSQGVDGIMEYAFRPYNNNPDVVLLPPLANADTIGEKYLGMTYRGHDNTSNNCYYTYLDIGYLLDTTNYTTFVTLTTIHQSIVEQYHYIQLPACSATRLAFRARSTSGMRGFSIDDLVISDTPFPTSGSVSSPNIGYGRKQLTWDAGLLASYYQYEWGPAGYPQGSGTVAMSDSCSLTIDGLEPNTDYDIYFIAADGQSSCTPYRFITNDAITPPYCEDFQQYNAYEWPDNWYSLRSGNYPQLYNDHYTIHLDFYNTGRQVAIMPEPYIDSIQTLTVNADYWFSDSRNYMEIGILDNPNDWNTFTPVDTVRATASGCWTNATVSFANYTGTGRFVGFHYLNNYSGQYIHVDNISLQNIPQVNYQVVSSTEIAVTSGEWPKNVDYIVEICNDGDAQGMGQIININTSPFIISGLTPGSTYQLYARADIASFTCASPTTLSMPERITLPYCEDFDAYGDCYNCRPQQWSYSTFDDDQNYTVGGNNWSLRFYSYYYNSNYVYAALPDLDVEQLQDVSIELNYRFESSSCLAELGVISSPNDWNSFIPVDTFLTTTNTWYTMRHDFNSYSGNGRFIAIRFKGNIYQYNYLYIDNIRLQACPLPNITLSAYNTVKFAIDTSHHMADYWVRVQSDNSDTLYHIDTNPYYITGLIPETQYTFSAQCEPTTESCFPSTSITTGILKSMPYCEDFNSYGSGNNCYPTGWRRNTVCGNDQIYTNSSNNYSLYFCSYYYNECNLTAVLPDLDVDSLRHISMQIRYRLESNGCPVYIGVQTDPNDNTTFTPIDTLNTSTNVWYIDNIDFSKYEGDGRYISIQMNGNYSYYKYLYIDYIYLQAMPLVNITLPEATTVAAQIDSSLSPDYWLHYSIYPNGIPTIGDGGIVSNGTETNGYVPLYGFYTDAYLRCQIIYPATMISGMTGGTINQLTFYTTQSSINWPGANFEVKLAEVSESSFSSNSWKNVASTQVYSGSLAVANNQLTITFSQPFTYNGGNLLVEIVSTSTGSYSSSTYYGTTVNGASLQGYSYSGVGSITPTQRNFLPKTGFTYTSANDDEDVITHIHITDNNFQIEDLEENTTYYFLPTTDSTTTSCWPWSSITTSRLQSIPYCEPFSDYDSGTGAWPTGWKRIISTNSNDRLYVYYDTDAEDNLLLYFNNNSSEQSYAVLPEMDIDDISSLNIRARMWQQGSTNLTQYWIEVGVMDDMTDPSTFVVVDTLQCAQTGRWENLTASLSRYQGNGRFIALHEKNTISDRRNIYIDRIDVMNCNIPGEVNITLENSNTVQVTTNDSSAGFYLEYGPTGFTQGNGTFKYIDIVPYDIPLEYQTNYDFYIRCDSTSETCIPKLSITTMTEPIELPYCENFDSYSNQAMPTGWIKLRKPVADGNDCYVHSSQHHTGNRSFRLYSSYTDRHPYAVLPEFDVDSLSQLAISFWMRNNHYNNYSVEIGSMSNPYDESTFVPLYQFHNSANNTWERQQALLTGADVNHRFIAFRFNAVDYSGSDWLYIDDLYIDMCGADNLQLTTIESESATITWTQTGLPNIELDIISTNTQETIHQSVPDYITNGNQGSYTIQGLNPLTNYKILFYSSCQDDADYCTTSYTDSVTFFTPAGGTGCIDPTNLTADYVTCYTGSYHNPYSSIGMVDNGADDVGSRHTIHYNPDERDPRTGNMLRTVPEGTTASVRLGNWGAHKISDYDGGEAEAITYALMVDTMAFDLLIMKYAAVMQDPMHDPADQPRFRLELLDENLQLIDAECGAADFIANQNLGWNTYGEDILWKDWTTVGLDMSAYAGQNVYIRLTTYDCNEGSHYGYAYFTLDCMRKSMSAEGCGNVASNIFTAPSGFAYRWYTNQDSSTYSTNQSINISSNNDITYYCNLSFVDNPSCQFTMSAFAGTRFPLSLFDSVVTIHDCLFEVSFNNHSTISMDGITPVGSGEGVETALWDFGNGTTSNNYHASTIYTQEGTYTVQLISAIAGGECTDTIEKTFTLVFPPTNPRIEGPTNRCFGTEADTLILHEALSWTTWSNDTIAITPTADSTYILAVTDSNGCTHTLSHSIAVHPVYDIVYDTAICDGGSYTFGDSVLTEAETYQRHLLTAAHECDSVITLNLTVNPHTSSTISETVNETQLPYTFNGHSFTDSVNNYNITTTNIYNCDSLITYNLEVIWNDKQTILDSTVCENHLPILWNGIQMPDTGTYSISLQAIHGEDSTVIMHVHTVPIYDDTIDHSICDNQQYTFEDSVYNGLDAGLHSHLLHTVDYGCDSLRTLRLDVRATTAGDTIADHCDQFVWYDTTYTSSTDAPTHLSTNVAGCDSTTTLHLTIRYSTASTIEETIVENDLPYTFNGVTFIDSVDLATVTIPNAVNCDSVISYTLHVDWNTGSRIDSSICINYLPITWNNEIFDTTVANVMMTRTVVIPSTTGSDSTIIMRLHVRPIYDDTIDHSICDNQQYTFEDTVYDSLDVGLHSHLLHTATYGCDSLRILRLDVRATTAGDTTADHCDQFTWYDTTYTASTNAPTHLSTNAAGCDSTTTLHLTIRYSTTSTIEETIVENDLPYIFNGVTFTDSTDLSLITIPNAVSCDSVISYTLHVDWNTGSRLDSSVCLNYLPITWNNEVFDTTVANVTLMRTIVIPSATGSDSTIIMRVHVRPIYDDTIDYSICDNQQYTFEDTVYDGLDAGLHSHMLQTDTYGCDSLRTLRLDVRATTAGDTTADHCDLFSWYDTTYTSSTNTPTHLSTNAAGCDSTTTLHLTIRYSSTSTIEETIVENDLPYTFNGRTFDYGDFGDHDEEEYNEQTTDIITIPNAVGCDSVISYTLNIEWNTGSRLDSNVCLNQLPITWNNEVFDTTVANTIIQHTVVIPASTGSDSTIIMRVHVRPIYDDTIDYSICDNQQYTFEDSVYNGLDAGLHSHMLQTDTYGCDSLRTLRLDVRATTVGDTTADHCDQFIWYNTTYTTSTDTPTHLSTNVAGCDSTTTLHLTIRYSSASTVTDTIVQNQLPYNYHDSIFADSISHTTVVFPNAVQCDSVVDYSLFVFWNVGTALFDTVCNDSLPLVWNDVTFDTTVAQTTTIVRSAIFPSATGADSVVLMHLTVYPLYDHHTYVDICDNQQYTFGDSTFLGSWSLESDQWQVVHLDSLLSQHGCDSLSTLHLSIHHTYDHHAYDTVCANQNYTWGTPQREMYTPWSVTSYLHGNDTLLPMYTADSLLTVTDNLSSTFSCDSISTLHLLIKQAYDLHYSDTICNAHLDGNQWQPHTYTFMGTTYDTTGSYPYNLSTHTAVTAGSISLPTSCDSIRTLHLKVYPTYEQHIYDTIYDGDTYLFEQATYDTTGIYPHTLQATFGCDSLRVLHLQRNRRTYLDSTVCQNQMPVIWNGIQFANGGGIRQGRIQIIKDSLHFSGLNGIDSLVVMTVTVRDTSATTDIIHACDSLLWVDNLLYRQSNHTSIITVPNSLACDSVVHLALTIDYTHHYNDYIDACDSLQWLDGHWYYADTAGFAGEVGTHYTFGPVDTLRTAGGCDSVVVLDLHMHYANYYETIDTFCYYQTYTWRGRSIHSDSTYLTEDYYLTDTIRTRWNCDSVIAIRLTKMARPKMHFIIDPLCSQYSYSVTASITLDHGLSEPTSPYVNWSTYPFDTSIDGFENDTTVIVNPMQTTTYYAYADYHETPLCPINDSLRLRPVVIPSAEMRITPEALSYSQLHFKAFDLSTPKPYSMSPDSADVWHTDWMVDWEIMDENNIVFDYTIPNADVDSVVVALRAYNGVCYDTALHTLPMLFVSIFSPNAFTPYQETNNRFTIFTDGVLETELYIYNREGMLIYYTKDIEQGWDGRSLKGIDCPEGNYVWKLKYRSIDHPDRWQSKVGSILLLK